LTPRERQVLEQLVAGRSNKLAAFELSISPRTIEIHRARIMDKLNARSLSDLVRTALAASMPPFTQH
jgi:two-component system response regulator FixJ